MNGKFHRCEIKWTAIHPTKKQFIRLAKIALFLDYDLYYSFEKFIGSDVSYGFEFEWRKPIVSFQQLLNLFHLFGFPCSGRDLILLDESMQEFNCAKDELEWLAQQELNWINNPVLTSEPTLILHKENILRLRKKTRRI